MTMMMMHGSAYVDLVALLASCVFFLKKQEPMHAWHAYIEDE
jgi:hypothetical protein